MYSWAADLDRFGKMLKSEFPGQVSSDVEWVLGTAGRCPKKTIAEAVGAVVGLAAASYLFGIALYRGAESGLRMSPPPCLPDGIPFSANSLLSDTENWIAESKDGDPMILTGKAILQALALRRSCKQGKSLMMKVKWQVTDLWGLDFKSIRKAARSVFNGDQRSTGDSFFDLVFRIWFH